MCPKAGELLKSVNVKNGQRVSAGMVLAVADTRDTNAALEKAKHDLERAKVDRLPSVEAKSLQQV